MNRTRLRAVLLVHSAVVVGVLASAGGRAAAQSDTQVWTEGGIEHSFSDRLEINGAFHLRLGEDASRVIAAMPEVKLTYRVTDWLRIGPGYRLERELTGSGDFETRHRLTADADVRHDAGNVRLGFRTRLQESLRDNGNRTVWRNKFGVDWRGWRPWVPGASVELFTALDDASTSKLRVTIGTAYELNQRQDLEIYYRYQDPDVAADPTLHIFGIGFKQEL